MLIHRSPTIMLLVLGVALGASSVHAQTQTAIDAMRKYPAYRHAVKSVIQQYESSLRTRCPSVQADWNKATAHVALEPTLDDQGRLIKAIWVDTVPGTACGQQRRYNAITVFDNGEPSVLPLFPGESESNPVLQKDTLPQLTSALVIKDLLPKGCQMDVLETRLPGGRPAPEQPWDEQWRIDACGRQYWTKVRYIPDATGTTINVDPKDIVPSK
ncbi:hypothetical protein [Xanthomonas hortorum]|uniref:hypothetical protein n=1 Tax=Xanthomonas hortorum TaxID=56454 RepID=UPI0015D638C9|nr:hypothetical protein [Xanthomonas hortorum]MCE4357623.1 hypothetical protein [Xanthomonas hortorum pv. taraxaci]NMI51301.1 hypothetical protein [Xanthomonas hortorum pv. taraxaci]CAD0334655.1 hypothetical protein NCPPB940_24120 [Xanthomonas hortorum pv. taraxaci]CAD0334661.1 hypothetical protein NCPPB940_24120 [Xanthomonas hortorum pv. taraxaci]